MQTSVTLVNSPETSDYAESLRVALAERDVKVVHLSSSIEEVDWGTFVTDYFESHLPPKTQHAILISSNGMSSYLENNHPIRKFLANSQRIKTNYILPVKLSNEGVSEPFLSSGIGSVDGRIGPEQVAERYLKGFGSSKTNHVSSHGSSNIQDIISYFRNSPVSEVSGKIKIQDKNIGYEVFQWSDPFSSSLTHCYLYIHKNASIKETINHYFMNNSKKVQGKPLIVIAHRDRRSRNSEIRREFIRELLPISTDVVYFCELAGKSWQKNIAESFSSEEKLSCGVKIIGEMLDDGGASYDALAELTAWLGRPNRPFALVKGSGGIGKTTLMKQFVDEISEDDSRIALFLEATTVSSLMDDPAGDDEVTAIFRIFKSEFELEMPEWMFFENIREGQIVLIIDGVDEIIGRTRYDDPLVDLFHQLSYDEGALEDAKILLTCRSYIFEQSAIDLNCDVYELQPFDDQRAKTYFDESFSDNPCRARKALEQCNALMSGAPNTVDLERRYPPYLLVVAAEFVRQSSDVSSKPHLELSSSILEPHLLQDLYIYQVCIREKEIKELTTLEVDDQIRLMCRFAVDYKGWAEPGTFRAFIEEFLTNGDHHCSKEAIYTHPFFDFRSESVSFKFDFMKNFFLGVYISSCLRGQEKMRPDAMRDCLPHIRWGTQLMKDIAGRLPTDPELSEDVVISLIDLKEQLYADNSEKSGYPRIEKAKIMSSMFLCLVWRMLPDNGQQNCELATELMNVIFGVREKGRIKIQNFCVCDLDREHHRKLIFDFRDKDLEGCVFDHYDFFWECRFDQNTSITDSWLKALPLKKNFQTTCSKSNISINSCQIDSNVKIVIESKEDENKTRQARILGDLRTIFRRIRQHGSFTKGKKISTVKNNFNLLNLSLADFLEMGIELNILEIGDNGTKVRVMKGMAESVELFVDQGLVPVGIRQLVASVESRR